MSRPGFAEGVGVALMLAATAATGLALLSSVFVGPALVYGLLTLISALYVLYVLVRSRHRSGRISTASLWLVTSVALWLLAPSLGWFAAGHVLALWTIRVLHLHAGFSGAFLDLALGGVGLGAAMLIANKTGSLFLAVWTFFLCQAVFAFLPSPQSHHPGVNGEEDAFDKAARSAELALRRIYL